MPKITCMKCGKKLTNPRSISLGVGPECEKWRNEFIAGCGSTEEELAAIEQHSDELVSRWGKNFFKEMKRKNQRYAKQCLEAARRAMQSQSTFQEGATI